MTRKSVKRSSPNTSTKRSSRLPTSTSNRLRLRLTNRTSERIARAMLSAYRPPPKLTVSSWADQGRYLSPESSASPGRWRTSVVPYLRAFMDAGSDPDTSEVIGLFASQTAKTEGILNIISFGVKHDPGPMLLMMPTLELAEAWSKDRLAPMLRDSPGLRGLVKEARTRDSGNTIRHKSFPGGHLTAAGANSAASPSRRPMRALLAH